MHRNHKLTSREKHVFEVYDTQIDPEGYLRMERALRWQPLKTALEIVANIVSAAVLAVAVWVFLVTSE